jgi:hypothetical protein
MGGCTGKDQKGSKLDPPGFVLTTIGKTSFFSKNAGNS